MKIISLALIAKRLEMKRAIILSLMLGATTATAQEKSAMAIPSPVSIPAPAEAGAIPLYGNDTPGSANSEIWSKAGALVAVRNVTRPTLTPVLPAPGKGNGAAVIVAPGGAFMALAMDHEGWKVARALADRGIAAFVLKYRLVQTPKGEADAMRFMGEQLAKEVGHSMEGGLIRQSLGPADARAALAMVRSNAAKWRVDPARVGIIGFSAGAMTSRRVAIDLPPAERPAFVGYIYGPQDPEPVPADAPPIFDAIAFDDMFFPSNGFPIAQEWLKAKRPVEVHAYQLGNHGFGLGVPGTTTSLLLDQFVAWLGMNKFLSPAKK